MGITQKTTPEEYFSLREWIWQGSPNSVNILEKETYNLMYTIQPITQENLVLASYWVAEHNKLIRHINDLIATISNMEG